MAVTDQAFPRLDTQAVDPATGRWTQPWYRFMISMWTRSGGGVGFDILTISQEANTAFLSDLMGDPPDLAPVADAAISGLVEGEERQDAAQSLDLLPLIDDRGEAPDPIALLSVSEDEMFEQPVAALQAVTVAGSPVAYTARMGGNLLISGGTVSAVSMTRGSVTTAFPAATAVLPLSPGDAASVTYTVAPTITFIPR